MAEIWDEKGLDFVGDSLFSSVMNYPFAYATKGFFIDETIEADELTSRLVDLQRRYGFGYEHCLQNLLDSHDTPRILTQIKNRALHTTLIRTQYRVISLVPLLKKIFRYLV